MNDTNKIMNRFFELARQSEAQDIEEPEELFFEAILNLVLQHPELKEQFMEGFLEMFCSQDIGSPDLIAYCMHELRWMEFKEKISNWLQIEKQERIRSVLRVVLRAFDDQWQYRDFYHRYSK